jgi:(p)ppGpp synthase/HD superfamily hydrolase
MSSDQQGVFDEHEMWLLVHAIGEAVMEHEGQVDKAGAPYIQHVLHVVRACTTHGTKVMTVAALHDIVEDTPLTTEYVRVTFGDDIADAVDAITKRDGEAYPAYLKRVEANEWARLVKIEDLKHNMSRTRGKLAPSQMVKYEQAFARLVPS